MACGEKRVPTDPMEVSKLAELELGRLKKKFHFMCNDKVALCEGNARNLILNYRMKDLLLEQKKEVELELELSGSPLSKKEDNKQINQIMLLLNDYKSINARITSETTNIREMDKEVANIQNRITKLSLHKMNDFKLNEKANKARNFVKQLENRLEIEKKRFGQAIAENAKLRDSINHMIQDRAHFNKLWRKIVDDLTNGKKYVTEIIEQTAIITDQKDYWIKRIDALKGTATAELMVNFEEKHNVNFIAVKSQQRNLSQFYTHIGEKRAKRMEENEEKLQHYQKLFTNIKKFARIENTERLVSNFIQKEREIISLFTYANYLYLELDTLNDCVDTYKIKIDMQRNLNNERTATQSVKLKEFTKMNKEAIKKGNLEEKQYKAKEKRLSTIISRVEDICKLVNLQRAPALQLLGKNNRVTIFNVFLYISLLERRTKELIQMIYYKENLQEQTRVRGKRAQKPKRVIMQPSDRKMRIMDIDKIVATHPCPLCVQREIVNEVITDAIEPDNREEVKKKLEARLLLPDALDRLHNVSACKLPGAHLIYRMRY